MNLFAAWAMAEATCRLLRLAKFCMIREPVAHGHSPYVLALPEPEYLDATHISSARVRAGKGTVSLDNALDWRSALDVDD